MARPNTISNAVLALVVLVCAAALAGVVGCSGEGGARAPSPPEGQGRGMPPGQVMITVAATSTPLGATVTGGGRLLGVTPFTVQVPIPAPRPGETQTFQFVFELAGHQPATLAASPLDGTISLAATLAPVTVAAPPPSDVREASNGPTLTVHGPSGGAIRDYAVATSSVQVEEDCTIDELSVEIRGSHTYFADLVVALRGPDGASYQLQSRASRNPFRAHTVRRAAGRPTRGEWTLSIRDEAGADTGTLRGWTMTVRCR